MALLTKPDMQQVWASGGDIVEPSDLKKQQGWTVEVPPHQFENWIQNRQDEYLAHINQRGIPAWSGDTEYEAGGLSYVQGSDGVIYKSVASSGPSTVTQNPTTDGSDTYWKIAFTENGEVYTKLESDATFLAKTQNLNDVPNKATARTNLSVYSQAQVDALISAVSSKSISGLFSNLRVATTGTSAQVTVTANSIVVNNSTGESFVINSLSVSPSFATAGVNGLDVGAANSQTASTWYYVWVIWNGTTTAGLLSLSSAAPTLPSGYTHKALVSAVRTDATVNKYPLSIVQDGCDVQYKALAGTNVTILPGIASGTQGTVGTTGVLVTGVSSFVPPIATAIFARSYVSPTSTLQLSPNSNMALAAGSPCFTVSTSTTNFNIDAEFVFEAPNQLYYAGNGSVPNCTASCRGYRLGL